jgi:microcystin-dependent protein
MANYEATRYDFDGANLTGIEGVNTGIVVPWGTASIPSGFLLCDGTSYATASYAALFAVIAYTYGGSGANFNVPDLRDKTIVGVSSANSKALAQSIGANTVTPSGNIGGSVAATTLSTAQIPSHTHQAPTTFDPYLGSEGSAGFRQIGPYIQMTNLATQASGSGQSHSHNLSANFSGTANSVLQPGLVLNYIIKT